MAFFVECLVSFIENGVMHNDDHAGKTAGPAPPDSHSYSGSVALSINVSSAVFVGEALRTTIDVSSLLLQTVVTPGPKTPEGRLIEAVTLPWFEIIAAIKNDPSIVFQISPRKWEEIIAGAYKKAGFDEVILTPHSGDLGRDVVAIKKGIGTVRVIDQVKAYDRGHLVTADDVRALIGVLTSDGASKGYLTTTSDFAPRLRKDRLIAPWIPSRIELINGLELMKRLSELASH
jgi:restriction system protein